MSVKHLILFFSILFTQPIFSQSELGTYFLENSGGNLYLNPSYTQDAAFSWTLPSLYYIHGSEGPGILGILKDNVLNLNGLEDKLKENNSFLYGFQGSLGALYFKYNNLSFHVGQNLKSNIQVDYNNLLFDILLNGNAPYIGESVNIGPYANLNFYNEFYFGFAVQLQNLSIGTRIKRLNGFGNAYTPKHDFSIYTHDEIYQLKFNTEYQIHTNLYADSLAFDSFTSQLWGNLTKNGGWAFDFGLKADILDQFTISASLLDMGNIHWKNETTKFTTEGNFEFDGFDFEKLITDSLDILDFDSLAQIINVTESNESYKAGLPVQFYLGLQYYPTEQWEINALFYNAYSSGRAHPSFSLGGKYKASEYFNTSLTYTWNRFSYFNLGWNGELNLKWFHLYLNMDNIIDIFRPVGGNYFNVRAGVQIDFVR